MLTIEQTIIAACFLAWAAYREPRGFMAWLVLVVIFLVLLAVLSVTGVIASE